MPELAEVEFYRRQWDSGVGQKIVSIHLNETKRIFRGTNTALLKRTLQNAVLEASFAHGKQMLFRFSKNGWLGVHLGMTGKMRCEGPGFVPRKHDHLVIGQKKQSLVFSDPRQFGRILFHCGPTEPKWWSDLPPSVVSDAFTFSFFQSFLKRHSKMPVKPLLLLQAGFPGIGNWMADEILWQAKINPRHRAGTLPVKNQKILFRKTKHVSQQALQIIGKDFSTRRTRGYFNIAGRKKEIVRAAATYCATPPSEGGPLVGVLPARNRIAFTCQKISILASLEQPISNRRKCGFAPDNFLFASSFKPGIAVHCARLHHRRPL